MIRSGRKRSYTESVEGRNKLLSRLAFVLVIYLAVCVCSSLFVSAWSVGSTSMEPALVPGERILATPLLLGPRTLFGKLPAFSRPSRGDVVIVEPPWTDAPGFFPALGDSLLRFFTAQRVSLFPRTALAGPGIERVIGLPGDRVAMEGFVFKIRPEGQEYFLTEFELADPRYDIRIPTLPVGWDPSMPFSGSMAPVQLGEDEYFVAGDDRGSSADSRSWGSVGPERFRAQVLLRYWPPARFGPP